MAGTPKWGVLHLRLSAMARDVVASPAADGQELKRLDRDAYLNYAWQKYIGLFYNTYRNDVELLQKALESMVNIGEASITSLSFIGLSGLPTDYGFLLKLSKEGKSVTRETPEVWIEIKNGNLTNKVPSTDNHYILPTRLGLKILPSNIVSMDYDIAYIIAPFNIVFSEDTGEDIPLDISHFDSILNFTLEQILNDRQEYALAAERRKEAYRTAPYPLMQVENG